MLHEADKPFMANRVEEARNIGIKYPVHFRRADTNRECIKCIMLTTPRSEPIRKTQKILLIDCIEHFCHSALDDLVFQGSYAERALSPVRFRYVFPT